MLEGESELEMPTSEHFRKNVEYMEENYGIVDCIYAQCIREFSHFRLKEIEKKHETRIVRAFLFDWGKMQRWLGNKGLREVCRKIKEKSFTVILEPLKNKSLKSVKLEELKDIIISLFNAIATTSFETKKGKIKNLNSTTASKILHLCCPDLFIMWDANIRVGYKKKNGDGKDYFQFLIEMQKLWTALDETIKDLKKKYGKRATRIIDEYNWVEFH